MKYYPMQMHAHSCFQPGGSMEGHIYNAKKLGMEYIHITDHDVRFGRKAKHIDKFDFSKGLLEYNDYPNATIGLYTFGNGSAKATSGAVKFSYVNEGKQTQSTGLTLQATGKRQSLPLLSNVSVKLGVRVNFCKNAKILVDCALSQRPPEYKQAHLKYAFEDIEEQPLEKVIILPVNSDGIYQLNVSKDCEDCEKIGGLDNALSNMSFVIECGEGGSAEIEIFQLEFNHEFGFQDVLVRQRALAEKIGKKYGVHPFVTYEISMAGQHKNVFSSCVPMLNYVDYNYKITEEQATEYVNKYNATFSWNHPFDNDRYVDVDLEKVDIDKLIEEEANFLADKKVYGASSIEVGFYGGKRQFAIEHHLKLWDKLSLKGIFITGEGNSDSHYNDRNWFDGQNAISWIGAPKELTFPISEEVFNQSIRAGRVYFGNPLLANFSIQFNCENTQMGGIMFANDSNQYKILQFRAIKPDVKSVIHVIINGERKEQIKIDDNAKDTTLDIKLSANLPVNFARVEIYDCSGNFVLGTNPIYLVRRDLFAKEIPSCRVYEGEA